MIGQFCFHRQTIPLEFAHFAGIACEHFDSTGGAAGVAAAAMEDVDAGIFNRKY